MCKMWEGMRKVSNKFTQVQYSWDGASGGDRTSSLLSSSIIRHCASKGKVGSPLSSELAHGAPQEGRRMGSNKGWPRGDGKRPVGGPRPCCPCPTSPPHACSSLCSVSNTNMLPGKAHLNSSCSAAECSVQALLKSN